MIAMRRRGVRGGGDGVKERGHKRGGGEARDLDKGTCVKRQKG